MTENITNWNIYGLKESMIASGYPMSHGRTNTMTDAPLSTPTWNRVHKLGISGAGAGHDCFLKGIVVQFDWRISQVIYPQVERYHFIDIVSSQSKMHRLHAAEREDFHPAVDAVILQRFLSMVQQYNEAPQQTPDMFETLVYSCPLGYYLTARFTTNYLQLKTMYHQRKNHKMAEWREFCQWVEQLPHFKWLVLGGT